MISVTVCDYVCFYLFTESGALQEFMLKTSQRNYDIDIQNISVAYSAVIY